MGIVEEVGSLDIQVNQALVATVHILAFLDFQDIVHILEEVASQVIHLILAFQVIRLQVALVVTVDIVDHLVSVATQLTLVEVAILATQLTLVSQVILHNQVFLAILVLLDLVAIVLILVYQVTQDIVVILDLVVIHHNQDLVVTPLNLVLVVILPTQE